ncbi:MAG: hypothetical protein VB876_03525 [Pirellulales bacterium]
MQVRTILSAAVLFLFANCWCGAAETQVVPGSGKRLDKVGDDFEDVDWKFNHNWPKSSKNIDERTRGPSGKSANGRWYEGLKRGQPDYIVRVPTPEGGLPGSEGALLLRSLMTGIPNRTTNRSQQDDLICNVMYRLGGRIHVSRTPSAVTRVYLPPFEKWEKRSGPTFAFRLALDPTRPRPKSNPREPDTYWPGMMIDFRSSADGKTETDTAYFRIRGNRYGRDYRGPQITQTGWWTMGMSVTPDGQVHYYVRPGVEDLRPEDHVASHFPYGLQARYFRTFFFNVLTKDDGKTWSTEWIVDDSEVYSLK